jgi:hypothetical protein
MDNENVNAGQIPWRGTPPVCVCCLPPAIAEVHAGNPNWLNNVRIEFQPRLFGHGFYSRVKEWSETTAKGRAFVDVFRKTTLQYARQGEDINRQIAVDAGVSESVLATNYVKETDNEMRQRSDRTFCRILASLPEKSHTATAT